MTDDEAREIYRGIFTVYPDYQNWLRDKVDDPNATLAAWRRMLSDVPADVGRVVASELQDGKRQMPAAYDRGQFGALLRSWCLRVVSDRRAKERTAKLTQEGTRGANATMLRDPLMGTTLRALNSADDALAAGEIDTERHAELRQGAWEAFHAVNKPQRAVEA